VVVISPQRPGRGLALDLAATVVVSSDREHDLLTSPSELARWLRAEEPWLGPVPEETALRLAEFRTLREAIRLVLAAAVSGGPIPEGPVRVLNAASAAAPTHPVLDVRDPLRPVAGAAPVGEGRTPALLAAIARSAIEIVGGGDRERLRVCPAPRCGAFYLASRQGRRWCSDACGNRARVARHHRRRRAAAS
jgi:predicted RNA-binding Zn ribbon-like protein